MQNKGVIRLFTIVFAAASLFELSFSYVASQVESNIHAKYGDNATKVQYALDSMSNEVVYDLGFASYSYKEVKAKEMNLGLDLRGGMNVILEVSVRDVLKGLVGNPDDAQFKAAITAADAAQANSQLGYLPLFMEALNVERDTRPLSDPGLYGTKDMTDRLGFNATDEAIQQAIQEDVEAAIQNVYTVLKARIDQFGVVQPNIQRLDGTGRILVELPGVKDPVRVQRLLQSTARLEFWRADQGAAWMQYIVNANDKLRSLIENPVKKVATSEEAGAEATDFTLPTSIGENTDENTVAAAESTEASPDSSALGFNPLLNVFQLNVNPQTFVPNEGPIVGYALTRDTATINGYLAMPEIRNLIPGNARYVRFAWTRPENNSEVTLLIALQGNRNNEPELDGGVIVDARQEFDQGNNPVVTMAMNGQGAQVWQQLTKEEGSKTPKGHVAVVLDNLVYSYPRVNGEISGGRTQIEGGFSLDEATDLANVLKAGKLPVPARIIQSDVVGPSLGKEAISASMNSFAFALLVVLLYMVFYYSGAGFGASLALVVNMFFIFGILDAFGAVLTLPGMAGIVLTIGMAVDANVLIYDRIREELATGKAVRTAIADGYKGSRSAIIDANVTTLLTAIILFVFGTGPIRGFATTLIIGIASSLFTAIFITRLYFEWRLKRSEHMSFATSITKNWFTNTNFKFMSLRKPAYIFSAILIIASLGSLFTRGLSLGVDFEGGRTYQVRFDQPVEVAAVAASLGSQWVDADGRAYTPAVKTLGSPDQVVITTNYRVDENGADVEEAIQASLYAGIKGFYAQPMDEATFINPSAEEENAMGLVASRQVGPTVADDIKDTAVWAVIFSLIAIFLYLLMRFNKWQYSVGAVAATVHDTIIVLGAFSLLDGVLPFSLEVDQAFIAAILTVIGYSLNDTVVVFDRIREFFGGSTKGQMKSEVLDDALNATLSRTFNTSFTTILVLLIIFVFGGEVLRGFIFAILLGIVVGTYSSLFIASPVLHDTSNRLGKEKP
ncbi:MAG: preprotein translocase subunit SecD [Cryomorphaceae bacterium BACL7 MAG-120910-bin2]|jgi:SecD/SecF fusion protein|nr:MAG: preprotein translocase subunit SecD [Cryomorphaceae bacterium BACL7 MAG-120910-bin2]KRO69683.1 MAG: preprotein translocase subunit SecD [Cryomorphaceae bacterium BACL7 MAG-120322-bin74]KRO82438.1 MAG: preprotein translocase subunit SecD [Cryomorphaceae bacterium BACL7 MAG-121220-bin83]